MFGGLTKLNCEKESVFKAKRPKMKVGRNFGCDLGSRTKRSDGAPVAKAECRARAKM